MAGRDVTDRLRALSRKSGLNLTTTAEADLASAMKEDACYVARAPAPGEDDRDAGSGAGDAAAPRSPYQLPDGQVVELGDERHRAPEVLFRPSLLGSEALPVHDVLLTAIRRSDLDLRATLFANVVLAGGTAMLLGLGDRLLYEVRARAPERTRMRISAPPERKESAWVGGSILASLATFKNMWVSRSDYEEQGARILHRG